MKNKRIILNKKNKILFLLYPSANALQRAIIINGFATESWV